MNELPLEILEQIALCGIKSYRALLAVPLFASFTLNPKNQYRFKVAFTKKTVEKDGDINYRLNNKFHREDMLPARIYFDKGIMYKKDYYTHGIIRKIEYLYNIGNCGRISLCELLIYSFNIGSSFMENECVQAYRKDDKIFDLLVSYNYNTWHEVKWMNAIWKNEKCYITNEFNTMILCWKCNESEFMRTFEMIE